MNKKEMVNSVVEYLHILNRRKIVKNSNAKYFKMLREHNIPILKLSREQKKEVDNIYKKYGLKYSYATH